MRPSQGFSQHALQCLVHMNAAPGSTSLRKRIVRTKMQRWSLFLMLQHQCFELLGRHGLRAP